MSKLKYFLALNRAIREEMSRDDNVILIGEDVGERAIGIPAKGFHRHQSCIQAPNSKNSF